MGTQKFNSDIDVSGEVKGTSLDVNGAADISGALTVGVNGSGHDVKLYGDALNKYMLWDESSNLLDVYGDIRVNSASGVLKIGGIDTKLLEISTDLNGIATIETTGNSGSDIEIISSGDVGITSNQTIDLSATMITSNANFFNFSGVALSALAPIMYLTNNTNDATGPEFRFTNNRDGNGLNDGDGLGRISFSGDDDGGTLVTANYGLIQGFVAESADGDEAGKMVISVANDATQRNGITMTGDKGTAGQVNVAIANGSGSTTAVAGDLHVTTGIELGHASDTTIARSAAGTVTIEGDQIVTDGAVNVASGASAPIAMRVARRTITQGEMNALHTTPIELIPAPGANKVIVITGGGNYIMADRTATNTAASTLGVGFDGFTETYSALYARRFMMGITSDILWNLNGYTTKVATVLTNAVNKKVEVKFFGACTTNCFTSVDVIVNYYILDLS